MCLSELLTLAPPVAFLLWSLLEKLSSFTQFSINKPRSGQGRGLAMPPPSIPRPSPPLGSVSLQGTEGEPENRESLTSTEGPHLQPLPPPPCPPPCPRSLPPGHATLTSGPLHCCPSAWSALSGDLSACPVPSGLCSQVSSSERPSEMASSVALLPLPLPCCTCLPLSQPSPYTLIHWFIFSLSCTLSATVLPASGGQGESVCPVLCVQLLEHGRQVEGPVPVH